jgi:hypothetical protein
MKDSFKQGRVFLAIGLFLIGTGIICNEWVLASLFSADGVIVLSRRIIIWLFDLFIITVGIVFVIRRNVLSLKRFVHALIMMVIMLLVIEAGLHFAYFIMHFGKQPEAEDTRYLTKPYEGKAWARELFKEYEEISGEYKEYRGWGKKEFHGKYVNIDAHGMRKTWKPDNFNEKNSDKIYLFGGSTIWGDGARDDYTIPSFISKRLHERGHDLAVYNYGEWAYTYTQGIIHLILLLRDGYRPDYVIFYDGIADIYGAYQGGVPGHLHYSFSLREKLQRQEFTAIQHFLNGFKEILKNYSKIYVELVKINRKLDPPESAFQEVGHHYNDSQLSELSKEVVEYYAKSLKMLDNLSKVYGFKYICFWQPVSFTEENLGEEDAKIDVRFQDEALIKLHKYTQDYLNSKTYPHFYNISDVLNGKVNSYYIDFAHISEEGNEIVANKIVSIFEKEYL